MTELAYALRVNEAAVGADRAEYRLMLRNSFEGMLERLSSLFDGEKVVCTFNFYIFPRTFPVYYRIQSVTRSRNGRGRWWSESLCQQCYEHDAWQWRCRKRWSTSFERDRKRISTYSPHSWSLEENTAYTGKNVIGRFLHKVLLKLKTDFLFFFSPVYVLYDVNERSRSQNFLKS